MYVSNFTKSMHFSLNVSGGGDLVTLEDAKRMAEHIVKKPVDRNSLWSDRQNFLVQAGRIGERLKKITENMDTSEGLFSPGKSERTQLQSGNNSLNTSVIGVFLH